LLQWPKFDFENFQQIVGPVLTIFSGVYEKIRPPLESFVMYFLRTPNLTRPLMFLLGRICGYCSPKQGYLATVMSGLDNLLDYIGIHLFNWVPTQEVHSLLHSVNFSLRQNIVVKIFCRLFIPGLPIVKI
jgi:hypothetical protein